MGCGYWQLQDWGNDACWKLKPLSLTQQRRLENHSQFLHVKLFMSITICPWITTINFSMLNKRLQHDKAQEFCWQICQFLPDGNIGVTVTDPTTLAFWGSALLTGVVETPVVLAVINSSLLVDPLSDWAPVCEDTDKGLERPEQGCAFIGWFNGTPSPTANFELGAWTWAFGWAVLKVIEDPFPARNIIAWTWKRCLNLSSPITQEEVDKQHKFM